MLPKKNAGEMSDGEAENKLRSSKSRAKNPWPVPDMDQLGSGASRGGGFGGGFGTGFGSAPSTGFGTSSKLYHPAGTGFGSGSSRRFPGAVGFGASGDASESSHRFHHLGSMNPSSTMSRRSRTSRRSGRRGRGNGNASHCYHCLEHGHFSKHCPKKEELELNSNLEGAETFFERLGGEKTGSYNARLENQKARDSYYGGVSSSIKSTSNNNNNNNIVDKFSEQLDNALKLSEPELDSDELSMDFESALNSGESSPVLNLQSMISPSESLNLQQQVPKASREMSMFSGFGVTPKKSAKPTRFGGNHHEKEPERRGRSSPVSDARNEMVTIETSRSIIRDGERHFEERTSISFPRNLPPNVRVITFMPAPPTLHSQ